MIDNEKMENLKKATLLMFENTIKEMKEKGIDTTEVEREYEKTKMCYEKGVNDVISDETAHILNHECVMTPINCGFHNFGDILKSNLFLVRFFEVPEYLVKYVHFENYGTMKIGIYESKNFCAYDYLSRNRNSLKGVFSVEYLDNSGSILRIDTYELKSIAEIKQTPLDYGSNAPVYVEVVLKYRKHGITTK